MTNDTIADMLTRIRNANLAKHQIVQIPSTKVTRNIANVLLAEGFIESFEELNNPNNVKVIVDNNLDALYFSRLPIPHASKNLIDYNHHIGVYAFLKQSLIEFSNLKRLNLEIIENLEGNRVVENSKKIRMVSTDFHGISIDTPEDLLKAEKFISLDD